VQYGSAGALAAAPVWREDANSMSQRNGTNSQTRYLYRTTVDASNYRRGFERWASDTIWEIGAEGLSTGSKVNITARLRAHDKIQFWNDEFGYEMGYISGGNWNINGTLVPMSADTSNLGGNGSNGGNGFKSVTLSRGTTATVGDVTMNKSMGRVNIAAAATAITVTNSRVAATSTVLAFVTTNDATAKIKNVVPAAGSFTINMEAAPTAQTTIDFVVIQSGN
jgi:hypothetical protein